MSIEHLEKLMQQMDFSKEKVDEYTSVIAQADALSLQEMSNMFKKYQVKAPESGNDLTEPEPFNLMFATMIGPSGDKRGYYYWVILTRHAVI